MAAGMNVADSRLVEAQLAANDRQLLDAAQRALRHPAGRMALVLHFSRMPPPAPRPHHRRIARALLMDTASRHDGQVFVRASGDLVLICRGAIPAASPAASPGAAAYALTAAPPGIAAAQLRATTADPQALPQILARLLRVDAADPLRIVSLWRLEQEGEQLLRYIAMPAPSSPNAGVEDEPVEQTGLVDVIGSLVTTSAISDLMQRQTAIILPAPGASHNALVPIYCEVTFSIAALEARITMAGHVATDPFLFRHLATRLDARMLQILGAALGRGGPLDAAEPMAASQPPSGGPDSARRRTALHVNLTLPGILSQGYSQFVAASQRHGIRVGVEVSLIEAAADPASFARARARIAEAGHFLVLDGVSHLALLISRPGGWQPDLLKLDWSPRLPDLAGEDARQVDAAILEIDPDRIVLQRAETEAAVRWGLARGIRRFQGRHVDAMLGASRIVACPQAPGCTLRQCIERAAATGIAGRSGCGNHTLLNAAAPPLHTPPAAPPLHMPAAHQPLSTPHCERPAELMA